MEDKNDMYLQDLINAVNNIKGGAEYVKNFNEKGGFVNNTSNTIQKAITDEWAKTSLCDQTLCTYGCLFRLAQQHFRDNE